MAGIGGRNHWSLIATDGAGVTKTLSGVQGEIALGDLSQGDRDLTLVRERDIAIGHLLGEERETENTWSALEGDDLEDWCLFCSGEGPKYGPGGTNPTVTTDAIGEAMATKLKAIYAPPLGAGKVHEWNDAKLKHTPKGGSPSTRDLKFTCIQRVR